MGSQSAKIVTMTPEWAEKLLDASEGSNWRKISGKQVEKLALAMKADQWDFNGESIVLNEKGHVIDGQHRLKACILAKKSFRVVLVEGVKSDKNIDTGLRRTLAQLLSSLGYSYSSPLSAITKYTYAYDVMGLRNTQVCGGGSLPVSNKTLLDWLKKEDGIHESAALETHARGICHGSLICFVHHMASSYQSPAKADEFFSALVDGSGPSNSAPFLLRNLVLTRKRRALTVSRHEFLILLIKAWNHWIQGETPQKLNLPSGKRKGILPEFVWK